ncbi:MAG: hypothetical protein IJV11_06855 [Muribaculaceae bacterium]|nr:hypothetical protein [Muribaculaceae bacterium]
MKIFRLFAIVALMALMCVPAKAQDDELRHEVAISYGALSNSRWIDGIVDIAPALVGQKSDRKKAFGTISAEYFYHTSPLVGVGGIFAFSNSKEDIYVANELSRHRTNSYFTLMPAVKFNWLRKNHWGMYSKIAAGAVLARAADKNYDQSGNKSGKSDVSTACDFNWQVSLVGIEAGGDHVRGFTELGIGEQGVFLAGIRCKF